MLLLPPLDRDSPLPLYRQIYSHVKESVLSGRLKPGDRMPSKRALAGLCGLSVITVEAAYAQLIAEGYIVSEPRRGTFVAAAGALPGLWDGAGRDEERIAPDGEIPNTPPPPAYDCRFGCIDVSAFPIKLWRKSERDAFGLSGAGLLRRGDPQGEWMLRDEIAGYLFRLRGVRCSPGQVVVGSGVEWLLLTLLPLLGDRAVYGIEEPGYTPYRRLLRAYGRKTVPLAVDADGVLPGSVRDSSPDVIYISPSHQFPLGGVLSFARRSELLRWAYEAPGRYIIEDDYDSELRYRGLPIPSLQGLDEQGRVIYAGTFSKSLAPALRIGYMVLPAGLLSKMRMGTGAPASGVSRLEQAALALFMSEGHFERHLHKMRLLYRKKRETLLELLRPYEKDLTAEDDGAGVFLRLYPRNGTNERELLDDARVGGVALTGLSRYYESAPPRPGVLMGFGGLSERELAEAADVLAKRWRLG